MTPRSTPRLLLAFIAVAIMAGSAMPAWGGYEVVQTFQRPGTQAVGRLLKLGSGEAYGTASAGGAFGFGSVFKVTTTGQVQTVVSFTGTGGAAPGSGPIGGLALGSDGALYGTTAAGGANGFGVVFRIGGFGVYTKLRDFTGTTGTTKGSVPGPLMAHSDGFLYGTTAAGGAGGFGTVFKITTTGTLTTLAEFLGGPTGVRRGAQPVGVLAASNATTLYGVTRNGGANGVGTIYRITTAGVFTDFQDFNTTNGANPAGGLLYHSDGRLYGTAEYGGTNGFGTLFSLTTTNVFSLKRSFADPTASQPVGELVASGNTLFGCCAGGGASGLGGLFKWTTLGVHTQLASFSGESGATPGSVPRGGLVLGGDGFFHGVTSSGGPANLGTVFKLSTAGVHSVTANLSPDLGWMPSGAPVSDGSGGWLFPMAEGGSGGGGTLLNWSPNDGVSVAAALGGTLGDAPDGALIENAGSFYGITTSGAASSRGGVFRYTPGLGTNLVNAFTAANGALSEGSLVTGADEALYGVSREGGANSRGTVFKVTTAGVRTRLFSFTGIAGVAPGGSPRGALAFAPNLSCYGLTETGGASNTGVIYRVSPLGLYVPIAQFGATGPRSPQGGLVLAADGFLYGTTRLGGAADAGTIIRIDPANQTWASVAEFGSTNAGAPAGELHACEDGSLCGIATTGGPANAGAVFRYNPGSGIEILATFTGTSGSTPGSATADNGAGLVFTGGLVTAADGSLYGTAAGGGPDGGGVLFRIVDTSPLGLWKTTHFGTSIAPDTEDPDSDSLPNLVEYALGSDPNAANAAPAIGLGTFPGGKSLSLLVPRDPVKSDVTLIIEASSTLAPPWTTLATSVQGAAFSGIGYVSGETPGSSLKSVLVRDTATTLSAPRRFMRLRVTR
jgi:uncharacterized repeat protein (TIGR03803 family)